MTSGQTLPLLFARGSTVSTYQANNKPGAVNLRQQGGVRATAIADSAPAWSVGIALEPDGMDFQGLDGAGPFAIKLSRVASLPLDGVTASGGALLDDGGMTVGFEVYVGQKNLVKGSEKSATAITRLVDAETKVDEIDPVEWSAARLKKVKYLPIFDDTAGSPTENRIIGFGWFTVEEGAGGKYVIMSGTSDGVGPNASVSFPDDMDLSSLNDVLKTQAMLSTVKLVRAVRSVR
ncbi:MAG: hypothetical protein U0744_13515 [Gemmataceae bacterium]